MTRTSTKITRNTPGREHKITHDCCCFSPASIQSSGQSWARSQCCTCPTEGCNRTRPNSEQTAVTTGRACERSRERRRSGRQQHAIIWDSFIKVDGTSYTSKMTDYCFHDISRPEATWPLSHIYFSGSRSPMSSTSLDVNSQHRRMTHTSTKLTRNTQGREHKITHDCCCFSPASIQSSGQSWARSQRCTCSTEVCNRTRTNSEQTAVTASRACKRSRGRRSGRQQHAIIWDSFIKVDGTSYTSKMTDYCFHDISRPEATWPLSHIYFSCNRSPMSSTSLDVNLPNNKPS